MKLSALPWMPIWKGDITTGQWFRYAREIGLDGVELMDGWFNRDHKNLNSITYGISQQHGKIFDPVIIKRVKQELAEYNHPVSMLTIHNRFCRFGEKEQQEELDAIRVSMNAAREFGTDKLRVIAAGWPLEEKEISRQEAMDACVDTIAQCVKAAASEGFYLLLENHPGLSVDLEGYAEILCRVDSPYLRANLDCKNTMRVGMEPTQFLGNKEISSRLMCIHIDNFLEIPEGWNRNISVDEGRVNIQAVLKMIKQYGYDGWLSIEYGGLGIEKIMRSAKFIREVWSEL